MCRLVVTSSLKGDVIVFAAHLHKDTAGGGPMRITLEQQWAAHAGSAIFSSPAVIGGTTGSPKVIAATVAGAVVALCALSGRKLWNAHVEGQVFADLGSYPMLPHFGGTTQSCTPSLLHAMHTGHAHQRQALQTDALTKARDRTGLCVPRSGVLISSNMPDSVAVLCAESGRLVHKIARQDAGSVSSAPVPFRAPDACHGHILEFPEAHTEAQPLEVATRPAACQWLQCSNAGDVLLLSVAPSSYICRSSNQAADGLVQAICLCRGGKQTFSGAVPCMCGMVLMIGKRDNRVYMIDAAPEQTRDSTSS